MSFFRKHAEPVRKARRDPQHALVFSRPSHRSPVPEARGTSAQVDGYVKNFSVGNAHKFSLRTLHLVMQAAQNVVGGTGMVVLHKLLDNPHLRHDPLVVAFEEETTLVPEYLWFEDEDTGQ